MSTKKKPKSVVIISKVIKRDGFYCKYFLTWINATNKTIGEIKELLKVTIIPNLTTDQMIDLITKGVTSRGHIDKEWYEWEQLQESEKMIGVHAPIDEFELLKLVSESSPKRQAQEDIYASEPEPEPKKKMKKGKKKQEVEDKKNARKIAKMEAKKDKPKK